MKKKLGTYTKSIYEAFLVSTIISIVFLPSLATSRTLEAKSAKPSAKAPLYQNIQLPIKTRIEDLLSRMSLDEKLLMIGGTGLATAAIPRLGIPAIEMIDGPQGVRGMPSTAFPGMLAMMATWNPNLLQSVSSAIGREALFYGKNMILGPCVTLYRVPQGGRNFECFSEDPFLNSRMSESYIYGAHDVGVMTSTKHFLLNNQEQNRFNIDMHIDERALHELELPAFLAAIKAGTESIMSSYNRFAGQYASENKGLLEILTKDLGFQNFILSDWGATHDGVKAFNAGLSIEMPLGIHMGPPLKADLESGKLSEELLNEKIRRILRPIFLNKEMNSGFARPTGEVNTPRHQDIATRAAQESVVLLKNDQALLPINLESTKSVAVIGPNAAFRRYHANGSGEVVPYKNSTVLEELKQKLGQNIQIRYSAGVIVPGQMELVESSSVKSIAADGSTVPGFRAEYWDNSQMSGDPKFIETVPDIQFGNTTPAGAHLKIGQYSARWSAQLQVPNSGPLDFDFGVTGRAYRFFFDGKLIKDLFNNNNSWEQQVHLNQVRAGSHQIRIDYRNTPDHFKFRLSWNPPRTSFAEAVEMARTSDYAIVVAGTSDAIEGEEMDRKSLMLPGEQEKLIHAINAVNPKTVVVVISGGPVSMRSWKAQTPAIIQSFFAGQAGGTAIADILTGRVNPSGKLPITIPKVIEDSPSFSYYPGKNEKIDYGLTGIFEGYRGYEKNRIEPEFAFGEGLSYSTFKYLEPEIKVISNSVGEPRVRIDMKVQNDSPIKGAEIVQIYVGQKHPRIPRPNKELKGFKKIVLQPGQVRQVSFELSAEAFQYWDPTIHNWKIDPDTYVLSIGSSSRDIRHDLLIHLILPALIE